MLDLEIVIFDCCQVLFRSVGVSPRWLATGILNCPHNEMKLKQNCFETVLFQFQFVVRTFLRLWFRNDTPECRYQSL